MKSNDFKVFVVKTKDFRKDRVFDMAGQIFDSRNWTMEQMQNHLKKKKDWIMVPYVQKDKILLTSKDKFSRTTIKNYFKSDTNLPGPIFF